MKKFVFAGACVLALAGCDQIKGLKPSPQAEIADQTSKDPAEIARGTFLPKDTIVPSADLGPRVRMSKGVTADITESSTVIVTTSAETPANSFGLPSGYSISLLPEQEEANSNSKLTVSVLARAPNGAAKMRVAYSTNEVGNSGWRDFELGPDYTVSTFEYKVPPMKEGNGEFIAFLTEGGSIEIASIGFDSVKLPPPASVEAPATEPAPQ